MKLTEQIDAMEASAVDPHKYLGATRVRACTLMLPLLTIAADFVSIAMAWITAMWAEPISLCFFFETGFKDATFTDLIPPIVETSVFGRSSGWSRPSRACARKAEPKASAAQPLAP